MALTDETIQAIIDRAASDPDFRSGLASDPLGTVNAAGYSVSLADVKSFLGRPGAADGEIMEDLHGRVSHANVASKGTTVIGPLTNEITTLTG